VENRSYLGSITKYNELGMGAFSRVYMAEYFERLVAYKEFLCESDVRKKMNIQKLTGIQDDNFVFPYKLIYEKRDDDIFKGYVMNYLENYKKLSDCLEFDYSKKVDILKRIRQSIDLLHSKYGVIHTDISPWNIMYNEKYDEVKLIDFDLCKDIKDKELLMYSYMNEAASYYAKYISADKDLDMFVFNITTYSLLNNKDFLTSFYELIEQGNKGFINNSVTSILDSYKNIKNNKSLKKEYIIDYL